MKSCPWFVSDTMQLDVQYSVGKLQQSETLTQSKQGNIWATRGNDGKIIQFKLIILYSASTRLRLKNITEWPHKLCLF